MIVTLALKDPDRVQDGLESQIENKKLITEIKNKFLKYGEYLQLEIDTDLMAARVIPNN